MDDNLDLVSWSMISDKFHEISQNNEDKLCQIKEIEKDWERMFNFYRESNKKIRFLIIGEYPLSSNDYVYKRDVEDSKRNNNKT